MSDFPKADACPFCGETQLVIVNNSQVACPDCGARGPAAKGAQPAIEAWNRRGAGDKAEAACETARSILADTADRSAFYARQISARSDRHRDLILRIRREVSPEVAGLVLELLRVDREAVAINVEMLVDRITHDACFVQLEAQAKQLATGMEEWKENYRRMVRREGSELVRQMTVHADRAR